MSSFVFTVLFSLGFLNATAYAQTSVQNQPVEVITATPLSSFSDRSGLWPTEEIAQDSLHPEGKSLAEELNSIPGIQARENGSPTISIRGSAQADRVLKLYEGVPLNLLDGMGGLNLLIPTEAIGSIRLFKGPASAFFGASAMGGAIDHRMRWFERPALRVGVADDSGVFGTSNIFAAAPTQWSSGDRMQFTAFHEYAPGRYHYESVSTDLSGRRDNNSSETNRVTASGEFTRGDWKLKPSVVAALSHNTAPDTITSPTVTTTDTQATLASFEGSTRINDRTDLSARISTVNTSMESQHNLYGKSDLSSARSSLNLGLNRQINDQTLMRTFLDYDLNSVKASYVDQNQHQDDNLELGQSYEWFLTPLLTLQPAFRYRTASNDFLKALALQFARNQQRVWLSYSEGFRAPSVTDLHADTPTYKSNPDLKPERSQAIELGFHHENGRRYSGWVDGLSFGGSAYYNSYTNFFESVSANATQRSKINSGSARSYGAEASIGYAFSVWAFNASHSWMNAKNEGTGELLTLSPEQQTALSISQQMGPVVLELQETLWSSYFDNEFLLDGTMVRREMPAWQTTDFNIRTLGLSDWEIKAGVTNIFDKPRELSIGYPEPQRRLYASVLRYF